MKLWLLLGVALVAGCEGGKAESGLVVDTGGDARRGAVLIRDKGCGSCHTVPGIRGANGAVGPPLNFFSRRTYIAGRVPNNPENLTRWILDPASVDPQTAMPALGLTDAEARDIAAYLYTLD